MEGSVISAGKRLRGKWEAGEPVFGLWAGIPSSLTAELAAAAGYDYVCVDLQHGGSTEATMMSMFQAAQAGGAVPLARLAWNEPWLIMRALDLGAAGVILPLIDNAAEAARAVEACRYPPHGKRSYGPVRSELVVGSATPDALGEDALCIAMIETRDGLDNLDEIAATPGLDGLYIGPSDLALALGLPPRPVAGDIGADRQVLADAIERVRDACDANGLIAGMHCAAGQAAANYADSGFKLITVGVDTSWYKATIRRELDAARGA
jgi:4-hydroxy-2-oxoheptanedioate aldolase